MQFRNIILSLLAGGAFSTSIENRDVVNFSTIQDVQGQLQSLQTVLESLWQVTGSPSVIEVTGQLHLEWALANLKNAGEQVQGAINSINGALEQYTKQYQNAEDGSAAGLWN